MSNIEELKKQLEAMETVTCSGPGMSSECNYSGHIDTFVPNYSGYHNACRCPKCGSTRNDYNKIHSEIVSMQCLAAEKRFDAKRG